MCLLLKDKRIVRKKTEAAGLGGVAGSRQITQTAAREHVTAHAGGARLGGQAAGAPLCGGVSVDFARASFFESIVRCGTQSVCSVVVLLFLSFVDKGLFFVLLVVVSGGLNPLQDGGDEEGLEEDLDEAEHDVDGSPDVGTGLTEVGPVDKLDEGDPVVDEGSSEGPHDGEAEDGSGGLVVEEGEDQPSPCGCPPSGPVSYTHLTLPTILRV